MSLVSTGTETPAVPRPRTADRDGWLAAIELARAESLENRRCARRVRYEARDALGVVLFSAGASTLVSVVVAVLVSWAA